MRKASLIALLLLGLAVPARAAEPSGCDKFKWPIERERAALTAPDRTKLASGNELAAIPASGITLALVPAPDAKLPMPPERVPKEGTLTQSRPIHHQPVERRLDRCGPGRAFP